MQIPWRNGLAGLAGIAGLVWTLQRIKRWTIILAIGHRAGFIPTWFIVLAATFLACMLTVSITLIVGQFRRTP